MIFIAGSGSDLEFFSQFCRVDCAYGLRKMNYYLMDILDTDKSEVKPNLTPRLDFHFLNPETFAMIRIWNFNRNRVHANRGVKDIVIELDKKVILE